MTNIKVGRYSKDEGTVMPDGSIEQTWQGWIEDEDMTWIAFIDRDGRPVFFLNRCQGTMGEGGPRCGGVLTELHPDHAGFYCPHHENPANAAGHRQGDLSDMFEGQTTPSA